MKTMQIFFLSALVSLLILGSGCLDTNGPGTPITVCNDVNYFGYRAAGMSNTSGTIEPITNTSSNFNTTNFSPVGGASFSFSGVVANNSATYDPTTQTMTFVDQWNLNNTRWDTDLLTGNTTQVNINSTFRITAPEYLNGTLYVLEVDINGGMIYLKTVSGATLSAPLASLPLNTFMLANDTMGNLYFSTTDGVSKLFYVGQDQILEVDVSGVPVLTVHPLPLPGRYLDLVRMQNGELVSVLDHPSGGIDVVTIDISGPAVVTSVVPNIDVNPESVAL
ncbi:MAG: hypothetical protein KDC54_04675, partial [Lewinella sp.]|nr:hypothetical protein [Lewinella sp.]